MRSSNVDRFNHDTSSAGYDREVQNESHPIRAGYEALLTWVADQVPADSVVVDLGCGTGNLSKRVARPRRLIGVDVSEAMTAIARGKLRHAPLELLHADLLECFERLPVVDAIASTYAVHHLTDDEKHVLFRESHAHLVPGGIAVFGDLMFESAAARDALLADYERRGLAELVADINDEYFWLIDDALGVLRGLGFACELERFSELSWGIRAIRVVDRRVG